jgi:glycosyltransferase involved in cell wall biosynthesis
MTENGILFSIVIPTYNRADIITKTIESVLSQSYPSFELIIVDDGSKDNTEEVIKKISDSRIKYFKIPNQERGAARNFGTNIAKGDYITFLDSDDVFYNNHLSVASENLTNLHYPELFHIRYEIINKHKNSKYQLPLLNSDANKKLIEGNFMSCNAVFLKTEIAKTNLFNIDRNLSGMEDWELWLRLATKYKINYCNTITSAIINHDERSVLATTKNDLINRTDTLLKYVLENKEILNYYGSKLRLFKASCYTYVALHLSLIKGNRSSVIKYLLKGVQYNPAVIFQRRFLATVKHFI